MTVRMISPLEAQALRQSGAELIDIRDVEEFARERIAGAHNRPLANLRGEPLPDAPLIFHCRSGMRTGQNVDRIRAAAGARECFIVAGGLNAWDKEGLPIERVAGAPIEMQRQVMIGAGLLVLTGTLLSLFASPAWIALAIFVGAGLTFAGVTGFCGMARILALMPWNRRAPRG